MAASSPRAEVLRLAILSLLSTGPVHGYALRKQLNMSIGTFRTLSYGSLYPALRRLEADGLIAAEESDVPGQLRRRITYSLTAPGREYLENELSSAGPTDWEDGTFDVRFQMFSATDPRTRLHILEGRHARMIERRAALQQYADAIARHGDSYARELADHALVQVENEIDWLAAMMAREHSAAGESAAAEHTNAGRHPAPQS